MLALGKVIIFKTFFQTFKTFSTNLPNLEIKVAMQRYKQNTEQVASVCFVSVNFNALLCPSPRLIRFRWSFRWKRRFFFWFLVFFIFWITFFGFVAFFTLAFQLFRPFGELLWKLLFQWFFFFGMLQHQRLWSSAQGRHCFSKWSSLRLLCWFAKTRSKASCFVVQSEHSSWSHQQFRQPIQRPSSHCRCIRYHYLPSASFHQSIRLYSSPIPGSCQVLGFEHGRHESRHQRSDLLFLPALWSQDCSILASCSGSIHFCSAQESTLLP